MNGNNAGTTADYARERANDNRDRIDNHHAQGASVSN